MTGVLSRLLGRGPLTRADRKLWAAAQTLDDLGELTAQWIEGKIESQPCYYGPVDVDEAPGLPEALIACNRAGYVTNSSQEGHDGPGHDGAHWRQLAAVTGLTTQDTYRRLHASLTPHGFVVVGHPVPRRSGHATVVTWREATAWTRFGGVDRDDIEFAYDECSAAAVAAAQAAWVVTVHDPQPGRNTLWPVLERTARSLR